jgi:acyl-CoA hydrolase
MTDGAQSPTGRQGQRMRDLAAAAAARPLTPRPPAESGVILSQLMELTSANIQGNVHGGEIMKLIDTAAGIAAAKHAGGPAVTVSLDQMSFLHPVNVGNVVTVKARVNDTGRTSMEVGVRVDALDLATGTVTHTSSAYLVFVALGADLKPRPIPPIVPGSDVDRRRQAEARIRRESRLARAEAIRRQRGED